MKKFIRRIIAVVSFPTWLVTNLFFSLVMSIVHFLFWLNDTKADCTFKEEMKNIWLSLYRWVK